MKTNPREKIKNLLKQEENEIKARGHLFTGTDPAIELARIRIVAFRQALRCFAPENPE